MIYKMILNFKYNQKTEKKDEFQFSLQEFTRLEILELKIDFNLLIKLPNSEINVIKMIS